VPKKEKNMKSVVTAAIMVIGMFVCTQARAEDSGMFENDQDEMEIFKIMLQAERKSMVAENMQLSRDEQRKFWPLYNEYQFSIGKVKDHLSALIREYAGYYRADHFPEKRAMKMLDQFLTFQSKLIKVKRSYLKRFRRVLSPKKVVRLYQIEHRLDVGEYAMIARGIPLAE